MNPIDYWYKKYIALKECERIPKPELTWVDVWDIVYQYLAVNREPEFHDDVKTCCEETLRRFYEHKKEEQ